MRVKAGSSCFTTDVPPAAVAAASSWPEMRVKLDGSSYFTTDVPPAAAAFSLFVRLVADGWCWFVLICSERKVLLVGW
jgi:hypothetical protein